jgi:hypothetical protein
MKTTHDNITCSNNVAIYQDKVNWFPYDWKPCEWAPSLWNKPPRNEDDC